jgi:hypothetical protein
MLAGNNRHGDASATVVGVCHDSQPLQAVREIVSSAPCSLLPLTLPPLRLAQAPFCGKPRLNARRDWNSVEPASGGMDDDTD